MTIVCPSAVAIFSVKMGLMVWAGPPAGNGTTNFTERFGNSWVIAGAGNARTQITHMRRINVNIATDSSPALRTYQPQLLPHAMGVHHLRRLRPRDGTQSTPRRQRTDRPNPLPNPTRTPRPHPLF